MTDPGASALVGQTLGDKFFVRRELGRGGMGAVYEAEHVVTKRVGALKLLHVARASVREVVARFVREASAAGHIENPHIVVTYDAGELASGEPYLFMELLEGSPVSALLEARGRLPFGEAREIVAQAAEALAAAHAAGIVHRDVKPDNLFSCAGPSPFVKVLDFGISKFAPQLTEGQPLTVDGALMGSPYYMSPEQVVGKRDIDFRTDIYSLGVALYQCLTGVPPFRAASLTELGVKIFEGRFERASALVAELPSGVDELLARAMAVDPSERYASMSEFRARLLALAEPRALVAPATLVMSQPPAAPLAPPRRRHWLGFALLAAAVALLTAFAWSGLRAPTASSAVAPSTPSVESTARAAPNDDLRTRVEGARSEPAPAALPTPPPASASSAARPPPAATVKRPAAAPASRAGHDGLIEANPF